MLSKIQSHFYNYILIGYRNYNNGGFLSVSTLDNHYKLYYDKSVYEQCKVAIVGGGIAGSYLAMRLSKKYGSDICLFDKDKHTGGRLYDIPVNSKKLRSPKIGLGGRRILAGQEVMSNLAKELKIKMQKPRPLEELWFARGKYDFTNSSIDKDPFAGLYPDLKINRSDSDYNSQLSQTLFNSPERKNIINHPNLRTYIESAIGDAGYQFLYDMDRFKSHYIYPIAAKDHIDWMENEYTYDYDDMYPVGGMSQFVKKLALKAQKFGARIFKPERIISINKNMYGGYHLSSPQRKVLADKVIIAAPAQAFTEIQGDIIDAIRSGSPLEYIIGINVMTITQWYKNAWWMQIKGISNGRRVWRAWTTDSCIRSIEIPREPYLKRQKVFRVAYSDDAGCIRHFNFLKENNITKLEEKIRNGLKHLFANNGITTRIRIPKATKTVIQDWPSAWYWIKAGSPFSAKYIEHWASKPLEGENVGLASDSYFVLRTGWSEAAVLSAMQLLKRQYSDVIDPLDDMTRLDELMKERSSEEIRKEKNHWRALKLKSLSMIEEDSKQVRHRRNPRS